jgi:hypothetical protein
MFCSSWHPFCFFFICEVVLHFVLSLCFQKVFFLFIPEFEICRFCLCCVFVLTRSFVSWLFQADGTANRIFYLSVPQEALLDVATCVADNAQSKRGWNRIIVEKPFGYDTESSAKLTEGLLSKFSEQQIYRFFNLHNRSIFYCSCLL